MVTTDVLKSTDMSTGSTAGVARFNLWKRVYAASENSRYVTTTSTFGGTTQTLPNASSTLGGVSEFFRNKFLDFGAGSTGDWTLQTPTEDRQFIIRNGSGSNITLDTTAGASPTLTIPNGITYTVNLYETGPGFYVIKDHVLSTAVSSTKPYAVASYQEGVASAGTLFTKVVLARSFTVPTNFTNSQGHVETAPTDGTYTVDILFNSTVIGTISFSTGSTTATFSSTQSYTFGAGDILELVGSTTPDSVADNFSFTIFGSV